MQTIVWEVECLSCANVRRHCKKCGGKSEFVSSGLFRVNANKKRLDVWLVYRCSHCGTSWNLPIHERVNPNRLPKAELAGFTQNDKALARRYAMNATLLARHGCEVQPPTYVITGPVVPAGQPVQVVLQSDTALDVRMDKLLRQKLGVSAKQLEALVESGGIRQADGRDLRHKLGREARFILCLGTQKTPAPPKKKAPRRALYVCFARRSKKAVLDFEAIQLKQHTRRSPVFPAKMQLPYARC